MVLAQVATAAKSNEITAVPALLKLLKLKGTIVTADAMNCQRAIAQQIVDGDGDYCLALKGNQGTLQDDVRRYFEDPKSETVTMEPVVDGDHGRIESRTAAVTAAIAWLADHGWPGLEAIGKVVRHRETGGRTSTETAYHLLSTALSPERLNEVARLHRGIENRLHWRLDVVMNEDGDRTRRDNGPHNIAVLRHMALNAMQKEGSKGSLRGKFKRAGWNDAFLSSLLAAFSNAILLAASDPDADPRTWPSSATCPSISCGAQRTSTASKSDVNPQLGTTHASKPSSERQPDAVRAIPLAFPSCPCVRRRSLPHRLREVGEGRFTRQPGQIRKEAALTGPSGSSSNLLFRQP